jgi:hypothetical protein
MHYELEARTRKALEEHVDILMKNLKDMESDFAECARTRKSPCFFCTNNDVCDFQNCNFKWKSHN